MPWAALLSSYLPERSSSDILQLGGILNPNACLQRKGTNLLIADPRCQAHIGVVVVVVV